MDITKRIGCMRSGIDDVRKQNFFKKTDWMAVFKRSVIHKIEFIAKFNAKTPSLY